MAINNTVILTGNMGAKPRIIEKDNSTFAAFSLATTDSYKDKEGEWKDRETVWHDVVAFSPKLIEQIKELDTKDRITVTGSLSYRFSEVAGKNDEVIKKMETSIIARKIEESPLIKSEPK